MSLPKFPLISTENSCEAHIEENINQATDNTPSPTRMHSKSSAQTPVLYGAAACQTRPIPNAAVFRIIYGRDVARGEALGSAALGRYGREEEADIYEPALSTLSNAPKQSMNKKTYAESGFQTTQASDRKRKLAKAKARASMMANGYRDVARLAGYEVWAESKNDRVIHSEQFLFSIKLDTEVNPLDYDLVGLFMPNVYGERIEPFRELHIGVARSRDIPEDIADTHSYTSSTSTWTSTQIIPSITPKLTLYVHVGSVQSDELPIPALAPCNRATKPDPESIEEYGEEHDRAGPDKEDSENVTDSFERSDVVSISTFLVPFAADISSATTVQTRANDSETFDEDQDDCRNSSTPNRRKRSSSERLTPDFASESHDLRQSSQRTGADVFYMHDASRSRKRLKQAKTRSKSPLLDVERSHKDHDSPTRRYIRQSKFGDGNSTQRTMVVHTKATTCSNRKVNIDMNTTRSQGQQKSHISDVNASLDRHGEPSTNSGRHLRHTPDRDGTVPLKFHERRLPTHRRHSRATSMSKRLEHGEDEMITVLQHSSIRRYSKRQHNTLEEPKRAVDDAYNRERERTAISNHRKDLSIRGKAAPHLKQDQAVATPGMKRASSQHSADQTPVETSRSEEQDRIRARRAEDRRRELPNCTSHKASGLQPSRGRNTEDAPKSSGNETIVQSPIIRPRRAVRDQINRWLGI